MREYFIYNGKSSKDFDLYISGEQTYKKPAPSIEHTAVPGRNGDILTSQDRFENIDITYQVGIVRNFERNFDALCDFLYQTATYQRLEDSYHPDYYRLGLVESSIEPQMIKLNKQGQFTITFNCKPQRFLKTGDTEINVNEPMMIRNPYSFNAKPLIKAYGKGKGEIYVGNKVIQILNMTESPFYLDCEGMNAYTIDDEGIVHNKNGSVFIPEFPVLKKGINSINFSGGIEKLVIIPRWWTI